MKFRTLITPSQMVRAKTNKKAMADILERIGPFLGHLSNQIYDYYGARWDNALSLEDILSFVRVSMIVAIKRYDPGKYDPKKDPSNKKCYLDGFSYLCTIGRRVVKYYYNYQHRQKRIPPEKLVSLDQIIDDNGNDLMSILHYQESSAKSHFHIPRIINIFRGEYVDSVRNKKIHLYDVVKLLLEKNMTYTQVAKKYKVSRQRMCKLIKDHIVKRLKSEFK